MRKAGGKNGQRLWNGIAVAVVILGILAAFGLFYAANERRIEGQNESYIADITSQRATLIRDLFDENLRYIESSSIVIETEFQNRGLDAATLDVPDESGIDPASIGIIRDVLVMYEDRFAFDYLRFIDRYGRDYTTEEKSIQAVVAEREYFRRGLDGAVGMTYILDSKVTDERQIGFYCPVRADGEIIGLAVGFYGEAFIREILSMSMFGYDCDVLLCDRDGTIIFNTAGNEGADSVESAGKYDLSAEDSAAIREALSAGHDTLFDFSDGGARSVGYVAYVGDVSEFFLVMHFPAGAYRNMLSAANRNGMVLLAILIAIFTAAGVFYTVRFLLQKRRIMAEAKNSNDIHAAVSRLFESFVLVDAETGTYAYIGGTPESAALPETGVYRQFADALLNRIPEEAGRIEAAGQIALGRLVGSMNAGADVVSLRLHAPVRGDEWFTFNFIAVSRSGTKVREFVVVSQDVTTLHAQEEETKRILQRARDEAEKGNRAKSDFLSNMSHEIRTPITAILGMNEMIQRESDSAAVLEYSDNIQQAGVSLLGIISDILDFSKIEAGRMELSEAEYALSDLIDDMLNLTLLRAEAKGLSLETEIDPRIPGRLRGDEIRIKQILTNLLSNAVKYTERGRVCLTVALERAEGDSVLLYVAVTDTGIGIRAEEIGRLFSPFDRLDVARTRSIEGTGLGLAITREMLSLMGSTLEVESVYGSGSKFFFTLRQTVADREPIGEYRPGAGASRAGERKRGRSPFTAPDARILLVDDTPMNIQVVCGLLKRTEMRIDTAGSGPECIEHFGRASYDLVFLDYRMPDMDGIETLARLREIYPEASRATPIVSLTASALSGDRERMLAAGFSDYLTKPVNIEEMENLLLRYLPPEKVTMAGAAETGGPAATLPAELSALPLLDTALGVRLCGGADGYLQALEIYAASIETRAAEIEEALAREDMAAYTIAAHSLKSTSRLTGAVSISELAEALERAGNGGDIETLRRDTPRLLELYRSLKAPLGEMFTPKIGAVLPALSEAEYREALSTARELCAAFDHASLEMVMETLEGYAIPAAYLGQYEQLKKAVDRCDWDAMNAALDAVEETNDV